MICYDTPQRFHFYAPYLPILRQMKTYQKKIQRKALTEMFPQLFPIVTLLPISSMYQQKKLIMKFFIHTIDVHVGVQYHCN